MSNETRHFGALNTESDMRDFFDCIRRQVKRAESSVSLVDFYKLAGFLAALADAPCWRMRCGGASPEFSMLMREELRKTARAINDRAETAGFELRVSENPHSGSRRNLRHVGLSQSVAR